MTERMITSDLDQDYSFLVLCMFIEHGFPCNVVNELYGILLLYYKLE